MDPHDLTDETASPPAVPQFAAKLKAATECATEQGTAAGMSEDEPASDADRRAATSLAALAGVFAVAAAFVFARQSNGPTSAAAAPAMASEVPQVVETMQVSAAPAGLSTATVTPLDPAPQPVVAPAPEPFAVPTITTVPTAAEELAFDKAGMWDEMHDGAPATPLRRVGLNYFVLRSTPDLKEAERRLEKALAAGVQCHIEPSLPGFTREGWWSLVTTRGYNLPDDRAAYDRERARLKKLGYEPAGYCWR